MRKFLFLALFAVAGAVLLSAGGRRANADCPDFDNDGVCNLFDCDDFNAQITNNGDVDADGDGFTVCMGDCQDDDPAIQLCRRVIDKTQYDPQPLPNQGNTGCGYTIHHSFYHCIILHDGTRLCDAQPLWGYNETVLNNC
jgi:hypothetical protein